MRQLPAPRVSPDPCPELQWIFVDAETFWAQDYSVRTLDPPSYILDPRFELICLGTAWGNADPILIDGPDVADWLGSLPDNVAMVSHNALFDMSILSWRYGYRPRVIIDTLAIARTLLAHKFRHVDLDTLGAYYGMPKGDLVQKVKGMSRADILASGLWSELAAYCLQDVRICRKIATDLIPKLPPEELVLHDVIADCAVTPALKLNTGLLAEHHADVISEKERKFAHAMFAGLDHVDTLMSNDKFAVLLQDLGVKPPQKTSPATGKRTWAMAKKDPDFLALMDHDDPRVVAVMEARMAYKSTLEETRSARMMNIGSLDFPHHGGTGLMPIPLIVGAAHTHRLGGGWKLNAQNWGRKSPIRKAIEAPEGYKLVAADSSQIEARMNAWFCGQEDLLQAFREGRDVYSEFASDVYGLPVSRATPSYRQKGKTGILQLGYQSGPDKYRDTLWVDSFDDPDGPIDVDIVEAHEVVQKYRAKYSKISGMWKFLGDYALPILSGRPVKMPDILEPQSDMAIGPGDVIKVYKGEVVGPTGLKLYYDNLRYEDREWRFNYAHSTKEKLYGGKFLENIVQFLARLAVLSVAVRLKKPLAQYKTRLTHSSHDEIVYLTPDDHVGLVKEMLRAEMTKSPDWAPTLPLACEIGVAQNYGDCK